MPSGIDHFLLSKNLPLPYSALSALLVYQYSNDMGVSFVAGVSTYIGVFISSRYLGPDVDLPLRTFNERGSVGKLISVVTKPFTKFTHHRGITHTFFFWCFNYICPTVFAFPVLLVPK